MFCKQDEVDLEKNLAGSKGDKVLLENSGSGQILRDGSIWDAACRSKDVFRKILAIGKYNIMKLVETSLKISMMNLKCGFFDKEFSNPKFNSISSDHCVRTAFLMS